MSHSHGKPALLLAAVVLVGCSAGQHDQAAPEPHRIFATGQWPSIMNQVGYTNLGVGWTKIYFDGKKADEILSLLGNPSRRGRDTTELYRHTSPPIAPASFDQVWQYCGPTSDLYVYLSHSNVVYAVYQYMDY